MISEPEWYMKLPDHLKPKNDDAIRNIENFRKENYLTDELMFIAICTTKWAVRRIQQYTLEKFRKEFPDLSEKELWKSVIMSRLQTKLNFDFIEETDPFVKPLSKQQIFSIIENLDKIISNFRSFEDVVEYIVSIDEMENRFYDITGMQAKLSKLLENSV